MSALNRTPEDSNTTSNGRIRLYGIYIGIIKANQDAQRMGRLQVYIPELGGNPSDESNWYTVGYASPFAGSTPLSNNTEGTKMENTQLSYGFWMVPPDVENQVLCCFVNGDTAKGYWFACIYQQFMNHMVPGIPLNISTDDQINQEHLPPVCEYNKKDTSVDVWNPKRPVFTPYHDGLNVQGLYTDPERGPVTSGARREAPSKVFGFSSPRGNKIVLDDDPDNEFIRIQSRSGAEIIVHETTGYIYMISKLGNSWLEISDIGIDMYSKRSISMRAEECINIHADQNIIQHSGGAIHHSAANITHHSSGRITSKADGEIHRHSPRIKDNSQDEKNADQNGTKSGSDGVGENGAGKNGSVSTMTPEQEQEMLKQNQNGDAATSQSSVGNNGATIAQNYTDDAGSYQGRNSQCVSLVQATSDVGYTGTWVPGDQVLGNSNIQPGTVIATFGSDGTYTNTPGQSHAAIYIGQSGNSITVFDQYSGKTSGYRTISTTANNQNESADKFYVVTH